MKDRHWAAASYLVPILPAVVILERKRRSPFLRFHAFQALMLWGVWLTIQVSPVEIPYKGLVTAGFVGLLLYGALGALMGWATWIPVFTEAAGVWAGAWRPPAPSPVQGPAEKPRGGAGSWGALAVLLAGGVALWALDLGDPWHLAGRWIALGAVGGILGRALFPEFGGAWALGAAAPALGALLGAAVDPRGPGAVAGWAGGAAVGVGWVTARGAFRKANPSASAAELFAHPRIWWTSLAVGLWVAGMVGLALSEARLLKEAGAFSFFERRSLGRDVAVALFMGISALRGAGWAAGGAVLAADADEPESLSPVRK